MFCPIQHQRPTAPQAAVFRAVLAAAMTARRKKDETRALRLGKAPGFVSLNHAAFYNAAFNIFILPFGREVDHTGFKRLAVDGIELMDGDEFEALGVKLSGYLLECVGGHLIDVVH